MKKRIIVFVAIFLISFILFAGKALQQKIEELEKKLNQVGGKEKLEVLNQLSFEYRSQSPKKCIAYGNQALELSHKLKDPKRKATALENIGIGYSNSGSQQESIIYLKKALKSFKHLDEKKGIADVLNDIGGVYMRSGNFNQALEYFQESLRIRKEIREQKSVADSLGNIGMVYQRLGEYPQSLNYQLKALETRAEIGDKAGTAASANNIGILYALLDQDENSLKYFLKSLKIKEEIGDTLGAASSLDNIGIIYKRLNDYEKALTYHRKALKAREKRGDINGEAHCYGNIAVLYEAQGHYQQALKNFQKSLRAYEETSDKMGVSLTLNGMGNIYKKLRNYDRARSHLEQSLGIGKETKAKNVIKTNYKNLSEVYSAQGNYKKALQYHQLYFKVNEEIFNEKSSKQMAEMQTRYDTLEKEKKIKILEKNNQVQELQLSRERFNRNAFIVGFILVMIILVLLFRKYLYLLAFWKKQKYIGQFRLMEKIGSGGMGIIYNAHHIKNKSETYAIKVLREELSHHQDIIKRFKQEATIIDKLDHPNIVKIMERGQYKQKFFIAMELLKGKSLDEILAETGALDLPACLHIMIQITDALTLIHSKNIIHRDLKPSNIMLIKKDGDPHFVKLLDFGVARMRYQTKLTKTGILLGTTSYLSPEQITNSGVSTTSDVFSLGIIFYEIVSGNKPFIGESESDIIKEILEKTPVEPHRFSPGIPGILNALIIRMLAKGKESRPSSQEILKILNKITLSG